LARHQEPDGSNPYFKLGLSTSVSTAVLARIASISLFIPHLFAMLVDRQLGYAML